MSFLEGILLGVIVWLTDAMVSSVLLTQSIGLNGAMKPLLDLESGSNFSGCATPNVRKPRKR